MKRSHEAIFTLAALQVCGANEDPVDAIGAWEKYLCQMVGEPATRFWFGWFLERAEAIEGQFEDDPESLN